MTKCIPVRKNTTGSCGQDAEEESPASEGKTETVEVNRKDDQMEFIKEFQDLMNKAIK